MRGNGGDGSGDVGRYAVHFAWWTAAALLWALGSDGGGTSGGVYGTVLEGASGGTDVLFFAYLMLGVGAAFELLLLKSRLERLASPGSKGRYSCLRLLD